jgi:hypothetical protein
LFFDFVQKNHDDIFNDESIEIQEFYDVKDEIIFEFFFTKMLKNIIGAFQ